VCSLICMVQLMDISLFAVPSSGLYFTLGSTVYQPNDTIFITAIGEFVGGGSPLNIDPGTSLVCRTELVNTQCCRGIDDGNVGEWFDPGGNQLPRFGAARTADFSRSAHAQQVRLNRRNNAMSPTGAFECRVPLDSNNGGPLEVASITIAPGQYNSTLHSICRIEAHSLTDWRSTE
jgi:hypothetical protein